MSRSTLTVGDAIKNRGSLHVLSDDVEIFDARIQDIVRDAILHSPTSFNCQSSRAVVLLKDEHKKFWDIAHEVAKASVAPPVFETVFKPRMRMFFAAYGTINLVKALTMPILTYICVQILFYESVDALKAVEGEMPIVKDKIPQWSEHASGMLQYAVWTMLTAEGLGVNLQHYNPMVHSAVAKTVEHPS